MTPQEFKKIRTTLGLSQSELAKVLRLNRGSKTIRSYESGVMAIGGPSQVAMELLLKEHLAEQVA